jgi:cysteinyl-tRNA synthetase
MALRVLDGPPIDIHAGGIDLVFPHHENEIAQAEGATNTPVRPLLDARRASVRRERKDVEVARQRLHDPDVRGRGHRPSALRYLLLSSHYRKQLNFTWVGMDQADEAIRRIVDFPGATRGRRARWVHAGHRRNGAPARGAGFQSALKDDSEYRRRPRPRCSSSCAR